MTVTDDGPGFDPDAVPGPADGHIGLALLTDAAEGAGGRLQLRARPGRGRPCAWRSRCQKDAHSP